MLRATPLAFLFLQLWREYAVVKWNDIAQRATALLSGWAEAETGRFLLFLPVFMAAGIVAYFDWPGEPPATPALAGAAALLGIAWWVRRRFWVVAMVWAGVACVGFAAARLEAAGAPPWDELPRRAAIVTGRVRALEMLPEGRRATIEAASLDGGAMLARSLRIRLRASDASGLEPGDLVRVRALLRPPVAPAYPGAWDTQRDAYFSGLGGVGFAIGDAVRVEAARGARWQAWRGAVAARIMDALPGVRGAIAATLMTGMGTAIPQEDRAAFQDSGLAHLLAVAGLHVGIVMGLAYAALRRGLALSERAALFWPLRQIGACGALAAGLFYLAMTGAHVPILRSFAMACLVTLALLTGRRALSMRGLAVAALVLMLAAPDLVMGVSFQMSFAAVVALLAGWEALRPLMVRLVGQGVGRAVARHGVALVVTSVLAGTASLPVAAYHFGSATLYYVPANMLAVPLTAFWVMPWGLAALALMPLGLHGLALAPMGWGISGLLWVAHGVAAWPDARVAVPQMPAAALVLMLLGLVWLCVWRSRARLAGLGVMAAGLLVAVCAVPPDVLVDGDARVVAVRLGGRVLVSLAPGVSRFDREAPGRLWGVARTEPFPAEECGAASCRIDVHGWPVVLMQGAGAPCPAASVVVSHRRVVCPSGPIVDRAAVAAQGATTIWLNAGGPVMRTVAGERDGRPWVVPGAVPAPVRLPAALTE